MTSAPGGQAQRSYVSGLAGSTLFNPNFDWAFPSVPQKHANNRVIHQTRYVRDSSVSPSTRLQLTAFEAAKDWVARLR